MGKLSGLPRLMRAIGDERRQGKMISVINAITDVLKRIAVGDCSVALGKLL